MKYRPLKDGSVIQAQGTLDRRFRAAFRRLVEGPEYTREFILSDVTGDFWRVFTEYCGDISGRYLGAVALGRTYTRHPCPRVDEVAQGVIQAQREDGHFNLDLAPDTIHYPLIYGHGRLLQGLVEYHSVTPSSVVLGAIRRLADYFVQTAPRWSAPEVVENEEFIYYTQALEGIVGAFRLTGDRHHLELARSMAGLLWSEPKHHSHSYLSSLLGVLALYDATGEEPYLRFVTERRDQVAAMVTVDGGVTEMLPDKHVTEYCSVADWFMLNARLGHVTGQAAYYEAAERILLNAVFFNQFANGGFGTWRVDRNNGYLGRVEVGSAEAYWCCSFHGVRSLYEALIHMYTVSAEGVRVNLFMDSTVRLPDLGGITIRQQTTYPVSGRVTLTVSAPSNRQHTLELRLPSWARWPDLRLNGEPCPYEVRDGYLCVSRAWGSSDELLLQFGMDLRLEGALPAECLAIGETLERVSLWWGPVLLAIDEMYNARGPSDAATPWTAPSCLLLPPGSPALPVAPALPVPAEWPGLQFQARALSDPGAGEGPPQGVTLTPLARRMELQPTCAPSTRTRYDVRVVSGHS